VTRESKLALMIAVTLILLVGVLLSDHLSGARTAEFDEPAQPQAGAALFAGLPGAADPIPLPFTPPQAVAQDEPSQGLVIPQDSLPIEINQGIQVADAQAGIFSRAIDGISGTVTGTNWPQAPTLMAPVISPEPAPTGPTINDLFKPVDPQESTIGGNPARTETPARPIPEPETRPAPRPTTPNFRTHTVEEGDSLYRLAARYLGDGNQWPQLQKLNADQLGDSENVQVGMVIKIAPAEAAPSARSAPARSQPAGSAAKPAPTRAYVVLRGDNLGKISLKLLGTSRRMDEIVRLNNLKDPDDIRVGQSLKIPAK
jgi:LysM repeat protein